MDWEHFCFLSSYHRLAPLVCRHLENCRYSLPADVVARLRKAARATAQQNLRLASELIRVLQRLQEEGIHAVPYKGPALSQFLYGDFSLRPSGDLDILVSPPQFEAARAALAGLNYEVVMNLSPAQTQAWLRDERVLDLSCSQTLAYLDLHCGIVPRRYSIDFDMEALLERSISVHLASQEARSLAPEDLLLVLSVHGSKHGWERLLWLCDIARLLRACVLDWDLVLVRARQLRIERILLLALWLARDFAAAEAPATVLAACEGDAVVRQSAARIAASWAAPAVELPGSVRQLSRWLLLLNLREDFRDRFRCAWRYAVTPGLEDWNSLPLPRPIGALYPAWRLLRIGGQLVRRGALEFRPRRKLELARQTVS
jgi:hypothetical protein